MHIRTKEDFKMFYSATGYEVFYRNKFVAGSGTIKKGRNCRSNRELYKQRAELEIKYCLAGISSASSKRCDNIDKELDG